jgi:hypothetical protein
MVTVADMHMMLVDGKVVQVDLGPMMRRHRAAVVEARAGLIGQAADVAAGGFDETFSADEVSDMWRASGLSGDDLDSAANAALVLSEIEQRRQ